LLCETRKRGGKRSVGPSSLGKCREAPFIDPSLNVAVAKTLEIDHRRSDIPVPHPLLQRSDIDSVLQVPGCVGVA
jgi:hypothetical protein